MSVSPKDQALTIGSQLASIESAVGRIAGMVMQAAIHHQPGVAATAHQEAALLDDMVTALTVDLARFRRTLGA